MDTSYRRTQVGNGALHTAPHLSAPNGVLQPQGSSRTGSETAAVDPSARLHRDGISQDGGGTWLASKSVKLSACTVAGVIFGVAAEKAKGTVHNSWTGEAVSCLEKWDGSLN